MSSCSIFHYQVFTEQFNLIHGERVHFVGMTCCGPLNCKFIDAHFLRIAELAQQIDEQRGNSDQPMQVIVNIGEDTILDKIIDGVNERSTLSGRNAILV